MNKPHRFTPREIAYLEFLASRHRPRSFDNVTPRLVNPLIKLGLIEIAPETAGRPFIRQRRRITDLGRAVALSLGPSKPPRRVVMP